MSGLATPICEALEGLHHRDAGLARLDRVALDVAAVVELLDDVVARGLRAEAELLHHLDQLALADARRRLGLLRVGPRVRARSRRRRPPRRPAAARRRRARRARAAGPPRPSGSPRPSSARMDRPRGTRARPARCRARSRSPSRPRCRRAWTPTPTGRRTSRGSGARPARRSCGGRRRAARSGRAPASGRSAGGRSSPSCRASGSSSSRAASGAASLNADTCEIDCSSSRTGSDFGYTVLSVRG